VVVVVVQMAGATVEAAARVTYNGLELLQPARVVLSPAFAVTLAALKAHAPCSSRMGVTVSQRSTLVLDGADIQLNGLQLDGALVVTAVPGAKVIIDGLKVHNDGCVSREGSALGTVQWVLTGQTHTLTACFESSTARPTQS
jgi:UDP-sugar pyrophosphorylase